MASDLLQVLDRRRLLAAAAAVVAASARPGVFAQTLITDAQPSDTGFVRSPAQPRDAGFARAPAAVLSQPGGAVPLARVSEPTPAPIDWRKFLLTGERSILLRRDGAAERIRYSTKEGTLDRDGYARACFILRDVRAGRLFPMDPSLLDILCGIQRWSEYHGRGSTIVVTSGFRTKETNSRTEGAAMHSMHLFGRAADIVLEGLSSALLGAMVREFNTQGGTGIYLRAGFVHVDTGAARSWVSTWRSRRR